AASHTKEELLEAISSAPEVTEADLPFSESTDERPSAESRNPWAAIRSIADLLCEEDVKTDWLWKPLVAPGAVTEMFSPRGLGKTLVAYAKGLEIAARGKRVLLVDRDNAPREVKRRLRAFGGTNADNFNVVTREHAPPLTDAAAWA